jgi:hypothetical protein
MAGCADWKGAPNRGGLYVSITNESHGQEVACANLAPAPGACCGGNACYGQKCNTSIPRGDVGYCLCADESLRYIEAGHLHNITCESLCSSPVPGFPTVWDAAFQACHAANDASAPACQVGNKGTHLQMMLMLSFGGVLLVLLLIAIFSSPSHKNLTQLDRLQKRTTDAR